MLSDATREVTSSYTCIVALVDSLTKSVRHFGVKIHSGCGNNDETLLGSVFIGTPCKPARFVLIYAENFSSSFFQAIR